MPENIIEFYNITKRFGGTVALDDVSFEVKRGLITGLVGENGSGKSTLINICHGVHKPDTGYIIYNGQKTIISHTAHAEELGISVVHQEIPICRTLNIASNIFLGPEIPGKMGFPDWNFMIEKTKELFKRLNVDIDPKKMVGSCSLGEQQLILIAKAIRKDANLIILDEPTSALSRIEVSRLLEVIKLLKDEGISILFVSHKLEEVKTIADEVIILKDGKFVGRLEKAEIYEKTMARMMIGHDITFQKKEEAKTFSGKPILEVSNLNCSAFKLNNVSFKLFKGEILGLAGLRGAGRTEIAKCIIGYYKYDSGEIFINGEKVFIKSPTDAIKHEIGYLTEDRGGLGVFNKMDIKSNLCIVILKYLTTILGIVNDKKLNNSSNNLRKQFDIKINFLNQLIGELSGGNQQKVLLARWLALEPQILILDEPTRGVDVGTKEEIRKIIIDMASKGLSIILISSEFIEIIGLCDRILVLNHGIIKNELLGVEATEESIKTLVAAVD